MADEPEFEPVIPALLDAPAAKEGLGETPAKYPLGTLRVILPVPVKGTVLVGVNTSTGNTAEPTPLEPSVSDAKVTGVLIAFATSCWDPALVDVDSEKAPAALPVVLRVKPVSVTLNSVVRVSARAIVMTIWVLLEVTAGALPVIAATLAAPAAKAAVPVKYPVGMFKVIKPAAATTVTGVNTRVTVAFECGGWWRRWRGGR